MIIFLYGPDTFRSRQKLQALKEKFIKEIDKSALNIQVLDGQTLEASEFEKAVATPPFLAKKRLVIIEDLISKNKGQKIQKEILETLDKKNLDETIIIFWEGGLTEAKRKKTSRAGSQSKLSKQRSDLLLTKLKSEKYAQHFELLTPSETYRWAGQEIKSRTGNIQPAALQLLTDLVGNDLWRLNSEIDKLISFAAGKPIAVADVESLVKLKLDEDVFRLTDALGQKNKKLALKLISDQLRSGTAPLQLLANITWQFKNLLLVKDFMAKNGDGYSANRLMYQLGLH
ncbi:MAG: DNA polymerase III subunit delta, partial [Patescibacteria group bacterium]